MTHFSRIAAIVIDVPGDDHDRELSFWEAATGQSLSQLGYPEYHGGRLHGQDIGLLIQCLGEGPARVHMDIYTDDLDAEVKRLEHLGAQRVQHAHKWWVMRDPAGLVFCVIPEPGGTLNDGNARRWELSSRHAVEERGLQEAAMTLRSHRRNLVVWSQAASSVGRSAAPRLTRTRRIRRLIRTGALLAIVGLMLLSRAGRTRWWLLLAVGVLTVVGVMLHAFVGVVLLFLVSAPFAAARPRAGRIRRSELEPDLGVYSHPAQLRLAIQAMDLQDHRRAP